MLNSPMKWLVVALAVFAAAPVVYGANTDIEWCYHLPTCNYTTWPEIAGNFCNRSRQSPINIMSSAATGNASLGAFQFNGFDSTSALTKIENTGKTVKVLLASGVWISGGGLPESYDSLQFHLHWGNGTTHPGSEHTVDGKRYPMELHIVNVGSSHHGNTTAAVADSDGLAALGFFIDVNTGDDDDPQAWIDLTSYLKNITFKGDSIPITRPISLNQLLVGVDRTKYYRYLGSLTTPNCNEAVVWTVFKQPVKLSAALINLFSTTLYIGKNDSYPLMTDVYRGVQPNLAVMTQANETTDGGSGSGGSTFKPSYTLGILTLILALGRN